MKRVLTLKARVEWEKMWAGARDPGVIVEHVGTREEAAARIVTQAYDLLVIGVCEKVKKERSNSGADADDAGVGGGGGAAGAAAATEEEAAAVIAAAMAAQSAQEQQEASALSEMWEDFLKGARKANPACFVMAIVTNHKGFRAITPVTRWELTHWGASMVTTPISLSDNSATVVQVLTQGRRGGRHICQWCLMPNLTEDELWFHAPLHHINAPNAFAVCGLCRRETKNLQVHLRNAHGLVAKGEVENENAQSKHIYQFALVVVRRKVDGRFLVVQEFASSGFWLPGGRVDVGETFQQAAIRETKEEAGIDIALDSVLHMEFHAHFHDHVRQRVVFLAHPIDEQQEPKVIPNYESAGATWANVPEIRKVTLRGNEPRQYFPLVEKGFVGAPLEMLQEIVDKK